MTLGAGQGKTLVYLLVALMLAKSDQTKETYKTFTVLTSSQLLEKQLKDTIRNHNIGIGVLVRSQPNFATFKAPDLYIVDESD